MSPEKFAECPNCRVTLPAAVVADMQKVDPNTGQKSEPESCPRAPR